MEWLLDIGKQVPALAVLAWVVHTFVRHLERRDEALKGISEQCHIVQRDAIETMRRTNEMWGEWSELLRSMRKE